MCQTPAHIARLAVQLEQIVPRRFDRQHEDLPHLGRVYGLLIGGLDRLEPVLVGDHASRPTVDVVPLGAARLSVRREIDAIALRSVHAVAIAMHGGERARQSELERELIGVRDHTTTLAVDVVPLGVGRLCVGH